MYSVRLAIARAKMVMGTIGGHDPSCRLLVPEQLWQAIQPLLPPPPCRYGGRPRVDDRACLAGIVYQLRTGIPWRPGRWPGHLLAAAARLAARRRLAATPPPAADQLGRQGQLDWSRACLDR